MKPTLFFLLIAISFTVTCQAQKNPADFPTWFGRWSERQTEYSAKEWLFSGKKDFVKIEYGGAGQMHIKMFTGTFQVDTIQQVVNLKFEKVMTLKNNEMVSEPTGHHEEWKIVSLKEDEIVVSRKVMFSIDTPNKEGDKENIYVRLKRVIKFTYNEPTTVSK
jgi:hypothetical protein